MSVSHNFNPVRMYHNVKYSRKMCIALLVCVQTTFSKYFKVYDDINIQYEHREYNRQLSLCEYVWVDGRWKRTRRFVIPRPMCSVANSHLWFALLESTWSHRARDSCTYFHNEHPYWVKCNPIWYTVQVLYTYIVDVASRNNVVIRNDSTHERARPRSVHSFPATRYLLVALVP